MKYYKCKETFYIDKYDEDGFYTGKQKAVVKGSKWQYDKDDKSMIIGNMNEHIHLERIAPKICEWIEISRETLEEYFEEIEEKQ